MKASPAPVVSNRAPSGKVAAGALKTRATKVPGQDTPVPFSPVLKAYFFLFLASEFSAASS